MLNSTDVRPIYLDYNATTPVDPAVVEAMLPYLREHFGNPSSNHTFGETAREAVDRARSQVANLINAQADEIVFTGGGSEASNLAIKGTAFSRLLGGATDASVCVRDLLARPRRWWSFLSRRQSQPGLPRIITTAIEHPATLQPCAFLQRLGCDIVILPVDRYGIVDLDALRRHLATPTTLVSVMHSNNEVGTIEPIEEIAGLAHEHGALVHVDAAQSVGKVTVDVQRLGVDFLTIAGHKLYAPKGVGALFVRRGVTVEPLIHGAAHENGRRAGTESVPLIVGLGAACDLAAKSLPAATDRLQTLRDRLWHKLQAELGAAIVRNGHPVHCLPNTLNASFLGHVGAELLEAVPEIAASTGSACHEGQVHLSPVLRAMGIDEKAGRGAIRLSVGRFTTEADVDRAAGLLVQAARRQPVSTAT